MNRNNHIPAGKSLFAGVLLLTAIILVLLAPKAAVNVDEQLHYPHAKRVVNWYFTGGKDKSSLDTPVTNLKYYGQSVDNFTALFNRVFKTDDEFLVRHYTGAFFFLLLLFIAGLLTKELSGSWGVSVLAVLALICMPRLSGQAFGNLKDIPFATGYLAGILYITRFIKEFPHVNWKTAILLGIAIAFTFSVRAGGFILFAYLGLVVLIYFALKPFYFLQIVSTKPVFVRLMGQGAAILAIGYFAGLLFWPFALQNIFVNPLESLRVMEHYKVSIRQVFEGELLWSTQLPWYYLPKWFLISTPLLLLAGFCVFIVRWIREVVVKININRQTLLEGFLLFAVLFPFTYVIIIKSNMYSGVRQMLFIIPPMIILSVWGLYKVIMPVMNRNRIIFRGLVVLFLIGIISPLKHQAETFPADYIYFNQLAGGNKGAWSNYEYDYYFHGIKQAVDYLIETADDKEYIVGMNCNLSNYFDNKPGMHHIYTRYLERSSADWDYGIFGINYINPQLLKNELWMPSDVQKVFYHKENPVAVLVRRSDKSDFNGISEINNGNLHEGIVYLENALQKQKNNVWLHVNLAKAYLELGKENKFMQLLEEGKRLYPEYEPLIMLEATHFYNEGKYNESYNSLLQLLNFNPRYLPAEKLFHEVSKELKTQK